MEIFEKEIFWANNTWVLTNKRAMYWPIEQTLIISDLHLGKAAYFRENGIPIPTDVNSNSLNTLSYLIEYYKVKRVLILGDLIHKTINIEVLGIKDVISRFSNIEIILVKGNHDKILNDEFYQLGIDFIYDQLIVNNILFIHKPIEYQGFQISGHIHAGVVVKLLKNSLRLPSFKVNRRLIILPAFSPFTGMYTENIMSNTINYAILDEGIVEIR